MMKELPTKYPYIAYSIEYYDYILIVGGCKTTSFPIIKGYLLSNVEYYYCIKDYVEYFPVEAVVSLDERITR